VTVDATALEGLCRGLLAAIGEDPDREGLAGTPARWARWWAEFVDYDAGTTDRTFECVTVDQLVMVRGIRVWSLCEHHLLPFSATISMGYITTGRVLGLSKFARVAHDAAHRLQLQERLVSDISAELHRLTGSDDVGVVATGEHLCMTMRGIRTAGDMVTSCLTGRFLSTELRAEFLGLSREG